MSEGFIYARIRRSDFDPTDENYNNFDEGAWESYVNAYSSALMYVRQQSSKHPELNWRDACQHLRPALYEASKRFWNDHDYDERYKAVHARQEAKILITPLQNSIDALKKMSEPFKRAVDVEAQKLLPKNSGKSKDIANRAISLNEALLNVCMDYCKDTNKGEGSTKFYGACTDLVKIWENIVDREFSPTLRFIREVQRKKYNKKTAPLAFNSLDAQFVFVTIYAISRRQAKPTQIETALNNILKK